MVLVALYGLLKLERRMIAEGVDELSAVHAKCQPTIWTSQMLASYRVVLSDHAGTIDAKLVALSVCYIQIWIVVVELANLIEFVSLV